MMANKGADREEAVLDQSVASALETTGSSFLKVRSVAMCGLYLGIYVREDLRDMVTGVAADTSSGDAWKNQLGNKGAVAIRLALAGSQYCFVNLHLDAGQNAWADRSATLDACLRTLFSSHGGLQQHDSAFLVGDFNSRTDLPANIKDRVLQ